MQINKKSHLIPLYILSSGSVFSQIVTTRMVVTPSIIVENLQKFGLGIMAFQFIFWLILLDFCKLQQWIDYNNGLQAAIFNKNMSKNLAVGKWARGPSVIDPNDELTNWDRRCSSPASRPRLLRCPYFLRSEAARSAWPPPLWRSVSASRTPPPTVPTPHES